MNYTIASTRQYGGEAVVDFIKSGNQYEIAFHGDGGQETTIKVFDTIQEALPVYQKFVEAFITGCFSYEDRKSWLK